MAAVSSRPQLVNTRIRRALALGVVGALVHAISQSSLTFACGQFGSSLRSTRSWQQSGRSLGSIARRGFGDDLSPFERVAANDWQNGIVQNIATFGAFVRVSLRDGSEADGLVHVSQLKDGFVDNVEDEVQRGQKVKVRVISVDVGRGKMSLSMKEGGDGGGGGGAPRAQSDYSAFANISPDTWLVGKVANCAPFGVFVTVTSPDGATADGLVHITQIREGFVENVRDEVQIGQEVKVRVVNVDLQGGKMGLSMKADGGGFAERAPADLSAFESIAPDTWLVGKVARCAPFGAFVTVTAPGSGSTADGLVHITQIKDGFVESVEDELSVGQEVKVRVISVDARDGKMSLSMKEEGAGEY